MNIPVILKVISLLVTRILYCGQVNPLDNIDTRHDLKLQLLITQRIDQITFGAFMMTMSVAIDVKLKFYDIPATDRRCKSLLHFAHLYPPYKNYTTFLFCSAHNIDFNFAGRPLDNSPFKGEPVKTNGEPPKICSIPTPMIELDKEFIMEDETVLTKLYGLQQTNGYFASREHTSHNLWNPHILRSVHSFHCNKLCCNGMLEVAWFMALICTTSLNCIQAVDANYPHYAMEVIIHIVREKYATKKVR